MMGRRSSTISNDYITSENDFMKTTRAGSLSSFTSLLLAVAVKFDLITRLTFMGRRKKIKYLVRTLFLQTRSHRQSVKNL
jgi:hypothetical protein